MPRRVPVLVPGFDRCCWVPARLPSSDRAAQVYSGLRAAALWHRWLQRERVSSRLWLLLIAVGGFVATDGRPLTLSAGIRCRYIVFMSLPHPNGAVGAGAPGLDWVALAVFGLGQPAALDAGSNCWHAVPWRACWFGHGLCCSVVGWRQFRFQADVHPHPDIGSDAAGVGHGLSAPGGRPPVMDGLQRTIHQTRSLSRFRAMDLLPLV